MVLVPTMGFFHEGHLSLMREGRRCGDHLVVSLFVNPTQFGPGEDLDAYPRDMDRDLLLAEGEGVDVVFAPQASQIYGQGYQTYVELTELPGHLCGLSRPGHFRGVATVVTKLFNIVMPDVAIFGEKDFQQLAIIRRLVLDLNFPIRIVGHPTVRDSDGLALSSRNAYLTPQQRVSALSLSKALLDAQEKVSRAVRDAKRLIGEAAGFIRSHPETEVDYIAICTPEDLEDVAVIERPALMALTVRVGKTRLIDNRILVP